jgi:hypothetical protein
MSFVASNEDVDGRDNGVPSDKVGGVPRPGHDDGLGFDTIGIPSRLPRVGVADNRSSRTSDESLRCCISYR